MLTIDLIVLGMLKKESRSAYDIQKSIEDQNISKWVKISTPSIYKKVIQLEKKGFIRGVTVRQGKTLDKTVYFLTSSGEQQFEKLMMDTADSPFNIFLDFNAVILNLDELSREQRDICLSSIERHLQGFKSFLTEALAKKSKSLPTGDSPSTQGMKNAPEKSEAVMTILRQQFVLAQAVEIWLNSIRL